MSVAAGIGIFSSTRFTNMMKHEKLFQWNGRWQDPQRCSVLLVRVLPRWTLLSYTRPLVSFSMVVSVWKEEVRVKDPSRSKPTNGRTAVVEESGGGSNANRPQNLYNSSNILQCFLFSPPYTLCQPAFVNRPPHDALLLCWYRLRWCRCSPNQN